MARDNRITEEFFYIKCRPLILSIIKFVFSYPVDYDELISELYYFLMKDDCRKLREFQFRSSLYLWLKIVAIRFFIRKRDNVIDITNGMPLYISLTEEDRSGNKSSAGNDLERLFEAMSNERYVYVIRKLVLEEVQPEFLARSMGITTANLYNIKKRAIAALTKVALKDKKYDERL